MFMGGVILELKLTLDNKRTIGILGAGAFGTALAVVCARNGHDVVLWCHEQSIFDDIIQTRINNRYLPDIILPNTITPTTDLSLAIRSIDIIFESLTINFLRSTLKKAQPCIHEHQLWVTTSKGIELKTGLLPQEIVDDIFENQVESLVLSGPTFARDLALGAPTKAMLVVRDFKTFEFVTSLFRHDDVFKLQYSCDFKGVQLCGAIKNVIAIICGIVHGACFAENTWALIFIKAIEELKCILDVLGGDMQTLYGLAGLGDLVLTALCIQGRNLKAGKLFGEGKTLVEVEELMVLPEGVHTLLAIYEIAYTYSLNLPIIQAAYEIVYQGKKPETLRFLAL
jgi:glycerol-3-phosphate dehydrogenase (NAD(P)+)